MPTPPGADVSLEQQQSADELWGPVPNIGVIDFFATDVNDDGVFADTAASSRLDARVDPLRERFGSSSEKGGLF